MAHDIHALVLRWYYEIWNQRREATIDELCSDEFHAWIEGVPVPIGKDGFRAHYHALTEAVPDCKMNVLLVSVEEPNALVSWEFSGTHLGPGLGIPPTGRPIHFPGLTWMVWKDGILTGGRDSWNRGKVLIDLMRARQDELMDEHGLTRRQAEVALLLAGRRTDKEISRELEIRPNTARRHAAMVLRKLGLHRRSDVEGIVGPVALSGLPEQGSDLPE